MVERTCFPHGSQYHQDHFDVCKKSLRFPENETGSSSLLRLHQWFSRIHMILHTNVEDVVDPEIGLLLRPQVVLRSLLPNDVEWLYTQHDPGRKRTVWDAQFVFDNLKQSARGKACELAPSPGLPEPYSFSDKHSLSFRGRICHHGFDSLFWRIELEIAEIRRVYHNNVWALYL